MKDNYDNSIIYIVIVIAIFFLIVGGCSNKAVEYNANAGTQDTPVVESLTVQQIYNDFSPLLEKNYSLSNSSQIVEYQMTSLRFTSLIDDTTANFNELNANELFSVTTVLNIINEVPQINTYALEWLPNDNKFRADRNGQYMYFSKSNNQLIVTIDNTNLSLMTFSTGA